MLIASGEYMKIMAAIKDPKTGNIYRGKSHSGILDELEDVEPTVFSRLKKIYGAEGCFPFSENVGFVGDDGILLSRSASQKKWGVFYSQDIRRANATPPLAADGKQEIL